MTRPKMILFDYGGTLMDGAWEPPRGDEAILRRAVKNPLGLTPEDLGHFAQELRAELCDPVIALRRELHEWQFTRLLYEMLQIEFSIPVEEQERVFFQAAAIRSEPMPHIKELLAFLAGRNIRAGVMSNIMSSAGELRRRIEEHFSLSQFDFIIASSDYGVAKPDPLIFKLALAKAGLPPEDVWFCGDNPRCDVEGSHAAGMFPVWYEDLTVESIWRDPSHGAPACPHLHIHDWRELIDILKELV